MNERPPSNRLREAMQRADVDALEEAAEELGRSAVALALQGDGAEDKQRQLDAALDDAMDIVARHRWRLGQRLGHDDGKVVRRIHALLRDLTQEEGS